MWISNVPDVIKCVSQFALIFIKRKNIGVYIYIYILSIFFCSSTNTANSYVSAPQARNFPLSLKALKFKKKSRIMISSTWAFNRDEWCERGAQFKGESICYCEYVWTKGTGSNLGKEKYTPKTFIVYALSTTLGRLKSGRRDGPDIFQVCGGDKYTKGFHTIPRGETNVEL